MRRIFLFFVMVVMSILTMAQAPQKMNFQALIRNSDNELVTNQTISVEITVLNSTNTAVYTETQSVTANANGVATLVIGEGTATVGSFADIDWSADNYYLQTTADLGNDEEAIVGTTPLLSVPYALYAEKAGNAAVDLSSYATKAEVETATINMATKSDIPDLTDYAKQTDIPTRVAELIDVADYAMKTDLPTVPTTVSTFTNDANYTKSGENISVFINDVEYVKKSYVDSLFNILGSKVKKLEDKAVPKGAIKGVFSVSADKKVYFSQGNLQYQASTNIWRFAENQYDIIGSDNSNISSSYSDYIDLFGWGTSGYNDKYPYMTNDASTDYGDGSNDIAGTNYDWGVYNAISNGGNDAGMWRTLTRGEWNYVLSERTDASSLNGSATVNGVTGMVLLPDDWTMPDGITFNSGMKGSNNNTYSTTEWNKLETNGAVFLPSPGYRSGSWAHGVNYYGEYWSSSAYDSSYASYVEFYEYGISMNDYERSFGLGVRLVQDVE